MPAFFLTHSALLEYCWGKTEWSEASEDEVNVFLKDIMRDPVWITTW